MQTIQPEIKQRIEAAAEALLASGITQPTNDQVRAQLGGGSLSHISPVMREWRLKKQQQQQAWVQMPDALREAMSHSLSEIWQQATQWAGESLQQYRVQSEQIQQELSDERDEALKELAEREQQWHQAQQQNQQLLESLQEQQQQFQSLQQDHQQCQQHLALSEQRLTDKDVQLQELKQQHDRLLEQQQQLQQQLLSLFEATKTP